MAVRKAPPPPPAKAPAKVAAKAPGKTVAKPAPAPRALAPMEDQTLTRLLEDANEGNNFTAKDLSIPFIRILQQLSPQVQVRGEDYVEGATAGAFFNTATNALWDGEVGMLFIPCWYTPSYTEWKLRDGPGGGGFVKDHGAVEPRIPTTRDDKNRDITPAGTQIVFSMNYFGIVVGENGEHTSGLLALTGTQLKKARKWNSAMDLVRAEYQGQTFKPPMYYIAYRLGTMFESNDKGSWFGIVVTPEAKTMELEDGETLLNEASRFRESVKTGSSKAKTEEMLEAEVEEDEAGDGGKGF